MMEFINKYGKSIIVCCVIIITITIVYKVSFSYAIDNNNNQIYSRDELSEIIKNHDSSITEINDLYSNNYQAYTIYVDNVKVSSLSNSLTYSLDTYTCKIGNNTYTESNNILLWDMGKQQLTQSTQLNNQMSCTLNFYSSNHYPTTLVQKIYNDNQKVASRTNFSTVFTENTTGKIYYISTNTEKVCDSGDTLTYVSGSGTNSVCKTFYYAGNPTNNYVIFGNQLWRIVRINEDQSVRLIFQTDLGSNYIGTGMRSFITGTGFGAADYHKVNEDLGFYYPQAVTQNITDAQKNTYRNASANAILYWVDRTPIKNYVKYLSKTAIYCNDRSIYSGLGYGSNDTLYSGYNRLITNKTPKIMCSQSNDRFAVSSTSANGITNYTNGKLTFGIALLTADEMAYSGKVYGVAASNYLDAPTTVNSSWHTMTPLRVASSIAYTFRNNTTDKSLNVATVYSSIGIRPVLSLKSCVKYTKGDGTESNPYEVIIDSACANSIN